MGFWRSQGQDESDGLTFCRSSFPCEARQAARRFCFVRQREQVEDDALSGEEVPSDNPHDESPHRQPGDGREGCAITSPLATRNAANATQATRRTHLLGILKSSLLQNLIGKRRTF